ncbi:MAG: YaeQ family protein [Planctomycetes bacterium]|nr:YaeQ family protein [Planctomycetota bacterium]
MGLTATMHRFEIELAHADRGVYASFELRVARHPSESAAFMIVRVLAYCIEYREGIAFSKGGISSVDEPAISICDLTGSRQVWIEVGAPSAERLHRASKATPRVALYTDRRLELLRTPLQGQRIHRAAEIPVTVFPQPFLRELEAQLERSMRWDVSISDGHLYVTCAGRAFDTELHPQPLLEHES